MLSHETPGRAVMEPENARAVAPPHGRAALQVILVILAVAAAAWVVYKLERVLLVLAVAMFFAYVVAPLVRFAQHPVRIAGSDRARCPGGWRSGSSTWSSWGARGWAPRC